VIPTGVHDETCALNGRDRTEFIVVGRVATDTNGTAQLFFARAHQDSAGNGNDSGRKDRAQGAKELRHCLSAFRQLASTKPHAQAAGRLGQSDLGPIERSAFVPEKGENVTPLVQNRDAQRGVTGRRASLQGALRDQ
jgi:hypothetical protein